MTDNRTVSSLIVGATGMLGSALTRRLLNLNRPITRATWPDRLPDAYCLDITDQKSVQRIINKVHPTVVYNCSAFTDVDGAEQNEELATAVNADGVAHLARACREQNSLLVHVSTDYVFDGRARQPYRPDHPCSPNTAYGRSKLAGETFLHQIGGKCIIVRTSWLFGPGGKNFVDSITALAEKKSSLRVVDDQIGCPTYAPDLADCLIQLADRDRRGIHHFCNPPACTWFEFAAAAVELADLPCKIEPCTTAEFPRPAPRPAYSVLDCSDTYSQLPQTPQPWMHALKEHLAIKQSINNSTSS